jgi:hypothetical protein
MKSDRRDQIAWEAVGEWRADEFKLRFTLGGSVVSWDQEARIVGLRVAGREGGGGGTKRKQAGWRKN